MTTTEKPLKPIKTAAGSTVRRVLRRLVREYELRYEMPTARMRDLIAKGQYRATADIAKWLHHANVLILLEEKSTAGFASARTRKSTNAR